MLARERLDRRLDVLLGSDLSPDVAYPARARLGRVVREALTWIDDAPVEVSQRARPIVLHLAGLSSRILQPSEPFDGRWQEQWHEARVAAQELRLVLRTAD